MRSSGPVGGRGPTGSCAGRAPGWMASRLRSPALRCATHRRRQCSAASQSLPPRKRWAEATSVMILSPVLALPGLSPRARCSCTNLGRPRCWAGWPVGSTQRWPPSGGHRRRRGCGPDGYVVAFIGCSWFGVVFLFRKPLSQMHRGTSLPLQHAATLIFSVDWGLGIVLTTVRSGIQ